MKQTIQDKLMQYAPEPPQRVWDAIAASLDETSASFSDKMYHYEVPPPAGLWKAIEHSLNTVPEPQTIPFYQRHKRKIHYSAAAAVLAIALFTGSLFISKKTQSDGGVAVLPAPPKTEQPGAPATETITVTSKPPETAVAINTLSLSAGNDSKFISTIRNKIRSTLHAFAPAALAEETNSFIPEKVEAKHILPATLPLDNYMIYSDGNGTAMKLPKKLFDFFACIGKNVSCKERMEQMQQKMARTSVATDFTGVLEILGNMNENQ
ncbi:MAG TPA: hypothetical protein VHK91_05215 [Flavisolibacter sp.]|jgi:hypothetical protein|nr:hypothetical protein [Flavisolibacter sp.]